MLNFIPYVYCSGDEIVPSPFINRSFQNHGSKKFEFYIEIRLNKFCIQWTWYHFFFREYEYIWLFK